MDYMSVPQTDKEVRDFIVRQDDFDVNQKKQLWENYDRNRNNGMDVQEALGKLLSEMYCY